MDARVFDLGHELRADAGRLDDPDDLAVFERFLFDQESFTEGRVVGAIKPTGVRPKFMPKIEDAGIQLPPSIFGMTPGSFF